MNFLLRPSSTHHSIPFLYQCAYLLMRTIVIGAAAVAAIAVAVAVSIVER